MDRAARRLRRPVRHGFPPDELKLFLKKRFPPSFWVPDRFEVITELPKTSVGKFDKKRLRNEYV